MRRRRLRGWLGKTVSGRCRDPSLGFARLRARIRGFRMTVQEVGALSWIRLEFCQSALDPSRPDASLTMMSSYSDLK